MIGLARWALFAAIAVLAATAAGDAELAAMRDRQDRAGLERTIARLVEAASSRSKDAPAQYRLALAQSYLAEVALELNDRRQARDAAEAGIGAAGRAVEIAPKVSEYHRILGTLCGQVIPANVLAGLKYGRCALESVNKAIELDRRSSDGYLSRGVGNYYLPAAFGGGVEPAIRDFEKAIELNPKSADAHLWLGIALRKANRNADARQALAKSLALNPNRVWARQQLEKTPTP